MQFLVTNIQRFSLKDGPGIRTTVFFQGCALRCRWCHNPETLPLVPIVQYHMSKCLHCKSCMQNCPSSSLYESAGQIRVNYERCLSCGICERVCPSGAITLSSHEMTLHDLLHQLSRDRMFYQTSGGGVTLSGGEPLLQKNLPDLLKRLHENQFHVAVDTALAVPWETIEAALPNTDLFLADLKLLNGEKHRRFTGQDNGLILKNLKRLSATGVKLRIRIPVIPTVQSEQDFLEMAEFIRSLPQVPPVEFVPFHKYCIGKYATLYRTYPFANVEPPSQDELQHLKNLFKSIEMI